MTNDDERQTEAGAAIDEAFSSRASLARPGARPMSALSAIEERAADWIAERDRGTGDGTWTSDRESQLEAWLAESTAHRVAWLRLDAVWGQADRLEVLRGSISRRAIDDPVSASRRPRLFASKGMWATAALTAACALVLGLAMVRAKLDATRIYTSDLGGREIVALKDGSKITLNTATRIHAQVVDGRREVWLDSGEAYFDIAHDAAHPFMVHAGRHDITVLGTKFAVTRNGDQTRVTVSEGRVQVRSVGSSTTVLTRDDEAVAASSGVLVTHKTSQQIDADLGWLRGKLVFDHLTIADAAREFNRYSHKRLVIDDPETAGIEIGGEFDAGNVDAFARLLQAGFQLRVTTRGDEIHIGRPVGY